jgi:tyrosyl-tRNA synthetase
MAIAQDVTDVLKGAGIEYIDEEAVNALRQEVPSIRVTQGDTIAAALVEAGLASSNTEARRFLQDNAISINGQKVQHEQFETADFKNGRLIIRRGKAFKDSALVELQD